MSEEQPPAESKPIPFKPQLTEPLNKDNITNPQTSVADCRRNGGHGGPTGKRVYTVNGKVICEICGETDIA